MKIIVLSSSDYKETDKIYSAITEDGYISFTVRGARSAKSKFIWLNNPLTIADIELNNDGRYKYQYLLDAKPLYSPLSNKDSPFYLFFISVITDVIQHMFQDDEKHKMFNDVIGALTALKSEKDPYTVALIFIAKAMKVAGLELEVNKCVYCGTTHDIVAFSFADGGFVCRNCHKDGTPRDLSPEQMRLMRYVSLSPDYSCRGSERYDDSDKKFLLSAFQNYIANVLGVNLDTINFIINY